MRRRLLVATSTYPRWAGDTHPGFVHELCARLVADHDVEVVVVAPTSHGAQRIEVVDGVRIHRFAYWRDRPGLLRDGPALPTLRAHPTTALQVPTYLAALHAALRRELAQGPFDALHAHWVVPQATLGHLARRRHRTRLVGTSHGSDVFGLGALGRPLLRWTLRHLDAFSGVSRAVVERAHELGLPTTTPSVVAPMGVDEGAFRPDPEARRALRAELGVSDAPLVLAVARLVVGKGLDVLVDAVPRVLATRPGLQVAILGEGQERARLERRAADLGLGDVVTFHGHRDHGELPRWYAAADVLVGPSRSEGFGLAYAEALACGCPVVATDLPAIREVVDDRSAGRRVPVDDPGAVADAVGAVLADASDRRAHAEADRQRGLDRWGWTAVSRTYEELLFGVRP